MARIKGSLLTIDTKNRTGVKRRHARALRIEFPGAIYHVMNALGGVTVYTNVFDGSGQTIKTNTAPDGGTRVEIYYQDGSLQRVNLAKSERRVRE